jgi:hypothetical protein
MPLNFFGGQQEDDPYGQGGGMAGGLFSGARANSLIGLGMGLLSPTPIGGSAWSQALRGWQSGAQMDEETIARGQRLKMERERMQLAREAANRPPEAIRQLMAAGIPKEKWGEYLYPKHEGEWSLVDIGDPLDAKKAWVNKRTREVLPFDAPPPTGAGAAAPPAAAAAGAPPADGGVPFISSTGAPSPIGTLPPSTTGAATPPSVAPISEPGGAAAGPPARNEGYLRNLGPNMQTLVKGVAEYEIDPQAIDAKDRVRVLTHAKNYRPDYSTAEYQKRGTPASGEVAARIGLGRGFIDKTPELRQRIEAGELNGSIQARTAAYLGQGRAGEIRRAIDEGADALLRGLTGAGMSVQEAANYARRYQFSPIDTRDTAIRKLNELEQALRYVATEVGKGRGGDDFLSGFSSRFGQPTAGQAAPTAPTGRTGGAAVPGAGAAGDPLQEARDAINRGAPRAAVIRRLRENGIDPSGL